MTDLAVAVMFAAAWVVVIVLALVVTFMPHKENPPMSDRAQRAVRTFVQAFLGTVVPLIVGKLADVKGVSDLPGLPSVLAPIVIGALGAAFSAAWNTLFPANPTPEA